MVDSILLALHGVRVLSSQRADSQGVYEPRPKCGLGILRTDFVIKSKLEAFGSSTRCWLFIDWCCAKQP